MATMIDIPLELSARARDSNQNGEQAAPQAILPESVGKEES